MRHYHVNQQFTISFEHHFIMEISCWSASFVYIYVLFLLLVWRLKIRGSKKIGLFVWRLFLGSSIHSRNIYWASTVARHYARWWGHEGKIAMIPALTDLTVLCRLQELRCQFDFIVGVIKETALPFLIT